MQKKFIPPFSLQNWIDENRHLLKPPVGNQQVFKGNDDFMVMVVGGPNARKDFHLNQGEELFYQLEGEIELGLMVEGMDGKLKEQKVALKAGEMFLLPPNIPHCPRRPAQSIGLVIERYRNPKEMDGFQWYCENCGKLLYEEYLPVSDIVGQLPEVMNRFYNSEEKRTCGHCGATMQKPNTLA
jgi:3-hydroxyanthranilate 3,4-dioxygenase